MMPDVTVALLATATVGLVFVWMVATNWHS
jgi:hypothetical protein